MPQSHKSFFWMAPCGGLLAPQKTSAELSSLHCITRKFFKDEYGVTVIARLKLLPILRFGGTHEVQLMAFFFSLDFPLSHGIGTCIRYNFLDPRGPYVEAQHLGQNPRLANG